MPTGGRNLFSEEDDILLVKYLAELSGNEGRKGNRIYQQLTKNASGTWPWSARHPWQSWRHRYMRDVEDMDRRIRVFRKRQAKTADVSQNASDGTVKKEVHEEEETESKNSPRKRKNTPAIESGKQVKRQKKDIPRPLANIGFVQVSQLVRKPLTASEDKGEGTSRNVIQTSDPPETRSRAIASTSGLKTLPKQPIPSHHLEKKRGIKEVLNAPPNSDDYSGQLFGGDSDAEMQLDPEAGQNKNDVNDDKEVNHMLTDPIEPDSDETNVSRSRSTHSQKPGVSTFNHNRAPRGSSDDLTTTADSGFFESTPPAHPLYHQHINSSEDIFNNSSDTVRPTRTLPFSKSKPVPKLIEGPFGGARHKHPVRRIYSSSSEDLGLSRKKKQIPTNREWPPERGSKKKSASTPKQSSANDTDDPLPSSKRGFGQDQRSTRPKPSGPPQSSPSETPPSRKVEERQIITEDEDEESSIEKHISRDDTRQEDGQKEEEEPLFTQPSQAVQSRAIPSDDGEEEEEDELKEEGENQENDETETSRSQYQELYTHYDSDEPLFTQVSHSQLQSQQSHPTSPPRSPSQEITTEPASSSRDDDNDDEIQSVPDAMHASRSQSPISHPFDRPESQSPSHYHTPKSDIHPFDVPDSKRRRQPSRSVRGVEKRPSVKKETAESVVRAINAFILEMDRSRRTIERDRRVRTGEGERSEREVSLVPSSIDDSEVPANGVERETIQQSVIRARGSPVPIAPKKKLLQVDERGSSGRLPPRNRSNGETQGAHSFNLIDDNLQEQKQSSSSSKDRSATTLGNTAAVRIPSKRMPYMDRQLAAETNTHPVASSSRSNPFTCDADDEHSTANSSMHSLFSAPSSSPPREPGPSTTDIGKDKGKNNAIDDEVDISGNSRRWESTPSTSRASSSHSKQIDLRQLERRRRSTVPTGSEKTNRARPSAPSPVAPDTDTVHSLSLSTSPSTHIQHEELPQSPLKLSFSDQARLIDQTIQNMSKEYQFPPDYVRSVWKAAGDLDEAAAILGQLRDVAGALLKKASARRSSGLRTDIGAAPRSEGSEGVFLAAESSSSLAGRDASVVLQNQLSNYSRHNNHSNLPGARSGIGGISRKSQRISFGNRREVFLPMIVDGPLPDVGYSPPTHSRAGQIALLSHQGRMREAMEREQRRVTGRGGVLVVHPIG